MSSFNGKAELTSGAIEKLSSILDPLEHLITIDHRAIWRRHLAWAKTDGGELRAHLTQRYSANMMFMALMLSAELMILFNSSHVTTAMRNAMIEVRYQEVKFWIGLVIFVSAFLTMFTLVSTFTAWGIVSSISDNNAHCFLRSSIGQYAAQLPSRLLVSSIYSFLIWLSLWAIELLPPFFSVGLLLSMGILLHHIVTVYSSFGRLIILTGGMGNKKVLDETLEKALLPSGLTSSLLHQATGRSDNKRTSATVQYRGASHCVNGGAHNAAKAAFRGAPGPKEADNKRTKVSFVHKHDGMHRNDGHRKMDSTMTTDSILTVESAIIRENAHAMFGAPPVPVLGGSTTAHNMFAPAARQPITLSQSAMPLSPVSAPASEDMNPSRRSSLDFDDGPDEFLAAARGGVEERFDSMRSDDSLGEDKPHATQRYGRRGVNARANRQSVAMSRTAEWSHESMARMMYDAPPAAGPDCIEEEEENAEQEGDRGLSSIQRASVYNRSVLASPKRQNLWRKTDAAKEDTDDDGDPTVVNGTKYSFFRGPTFPLTTMLSRVMEGTLESDSEHPPRDDSYLSNLSHSSSGVFEKMSKWRGSSSSVGLSPEEKRLLERTGDKNNYDLVEQDEDLESSMGRCLEIATEGGSNGMKVGSGRAC